MILLNHNSLENLIREEVEVLCDYISNDSRVLSIKANQSLQILEKFNSDWYFVNYQNSVGFFPSIYLKEKGKFF